MIDNNINFYEDDTDYIEEAMINSETWYIWEVMTTPIKFGCDLDTYRLNLKIKNAKNLIQDQKNISHYNFVFPINTIGKDALRNLNAFKSEYQGYVSIKFYDNEDTERFIQQIIKLNSSIQTIGDLVSYIQEVRRKSLGFL